MRPYGRFAKEDYLATVFLSPIARFSAAYGEMRACTRNDLAEDAGVLIVIDRKRFREKGLKARYVGADGRPVTECGYGPEKIRGNYIHRMTTLGCHETIPPTAFSQIWFPEGYLFDERGQLREGRQELLDSIRSKGIETLKIPRGYKFPVDRLVL